MKISLFSSILNKNNYLFNINKLLRYSSKYYDKDLSEKN